MAGPEAPEKRPKVLRILLCVDPESDVVLQGSAICTQGLAQKADSPASSAAAHGNAVFSPAMTEAIDPAHQSAAPG